MSCLLAPVISLVNCPLVSVSGVYNSVALALAGAAQLVRAPCHTPKAGRFHSGRAHAGGNQTHSLSLPLSEPFKTRLCFLRDLCAPAPLSFVIGIASVFFLFGVITLFSEMRQSTSERCALYFWGYKACPEESRVRRSGGELSADVYRHTLSWTWRGSPIHSPRHWREEPGAFMVVRQLGRNSLLPPATAHV